MFTYEASGKLKVQNCGKIVDVYYVPQCSYRFLPGDEAWLLYRAIKGKLEKIVVKKTKLITSSLYNGRGECIVMYFDTFNAAYNSDELITLEEASSLVSIYNRNQILEIERAACLL